MNYFTHYIIQREPEQHLL